MFGSKIAGAAIGVGLGGSLLAASLYNVDAGHRGVIYDRFRGVLPNVKREGTHLLLPIIQRPIIFDVRFV